MSTEAKNLKTIEMTVNLKKITHNVSWTKKAPFAVRNIKRLIQKTFNSKDEVLIAPELNKAIWVRGMRHVPSKVRIRVERVQGQKENMFKVSLVIVGSFKGLQTQVLAE